MLASLVRASVAATALACLPAAGAIASEPAVNAGAALLCRSAIAATEATTRIPDAFLNAIGRVESGRALPASGLVAPWPWTVNAAGEGHFYASKAEAIAAVQQFQASGIKSLDVGCLQVNIMYHPEAFASLEQAFDPASNAAYAGRLLLALHQQTGSWPRAAAAYHSQTPGIGAAYAEKVLEAWAEPDRAPAAGAAPPPAAPPRQAATATLAMAAPASVRALPSAAGFTQDFRLAPRPGAAAPVATGRSLAAYRALPVQFAARAPIPVAMR